METQKRETIAFDHSGLKDLLKAFMNDPFVVEQKLSQLSLEEIGRYVEEQQEEVGSSDALERVKGSYCLILLELELLSYSCVPEESLSEFNQKLFGAEELPIEKSYSLQDLTFTSAPIDLNDLVLPGGARFESSGPKEVELPKKNFQSEIARAYYELSHTLTVAGSFPRSIRSEDLERLHVQCQIWSLESELLTRTKSSLETFWPQRDTHVARVICQNRHAYDFHPALREGFEQFAKNHPGWLYEGKFPIAGMMASLRYLLSVPTMEKFVPACIDFSALILLFGRNAEYKAQLIYNVLGINAITPEEILELSARLSRLQRLKAKVLNPHQVLTKEIIQTASSDFEATLPLVLRLQAHPKEASIKNVA